MIVNGISMTVNLAALFDIIPKIELGDTVYGDIFISIVGMVVNQLEAFNVHFTHHLTIIQPLRLYLSSQVHCPLNYSGLHVSFLTKNSKLVSCRLDSWPCRSP